MSTDTRWRVLLETQTKAGTYHRKTWLSAEQQEVAKCERHYGDVLHKVQENDALHNEARAVPGTVPKKLAKAGKAGKGDPGGAAVKGLRQDICDAHGKILEAQISADLKMLNAATEKVTEAKPLSGHVPANSNGNGGWEKIFQEDVGHDPNQAHATTTGLQPNGIGEKMSEEREKEIKDGKLKFAELTDTTQQKNYHKAMSRTNGHLEKMYTQIAVNNTRLNNKGLILPPDTDEFQTSNDHVVMRPIKYTAEWHLEKLIKDPTDLEEVLIEMPPDGTGVFKNEQDRKMAYHFHFQNPNDMVMDTGASDSKISAPICETFPPRPMVGNRDYLVSSAGGDPGKTAVARHAKVDFPRTLFFHMEDGPLRKDKAGLARTEHDRVMPLMEVKKDDRGSEDCVIHRNPLHLAVMENDATMVNKLTQLCNCWRDKVAMDIIHPEEHHTYFNEDDPSHLPAKPTDEIGYKRLHVEFVEEILLKGGSTWEEFPTFAVKAMLKHVEEYNERFNAFFPNVIKEKATLLTEEFKAFWMAYGMNGRGSKLHQTKIIPGKKEKRCNFFTFKKGIKDALHVMDANNQPKCGCDGMDDYQAESPDGEKNKYDTLQHYLIWKMAGSPPMLKTRDSDDIKLAANKPGFPFIEIVGGVWERSTDARTRQNARRGAYPYPRPPHLNQLVPKGGKGYPAKHVYDAMRYACEREAEFLKLCDYSMNKYAVGSKRFSLAIPEQSTNSSVGSKPDGKGLGFTVIRREPYFKKDPKPQHYSGTDRNGDRIADPTDFEQAPDNQYSLIRKDARPWNHACLAPDRFQWRSDLAKPLDTKPREGLDYQGLAGKRDGRGALGQKMMNIGDPWEWWQSDRDHMKVSGLEELDKRTGLFGSGFHKPSIWKTDILPKDTPSSPSRHDRHPYIMPFTPFHLAAVYNSDLSMRELLKHWIAWRPYHDMNADWAHDQGFWRRRYLKEQVAFFSGIRYVTDGREPPKYEPPGWRRADAGNLAKVSPNERHLDLGVTDKSLRGADGKQSYDEMDKKKGTAFLKAPEEMKAMLAEERIPLWRHTHYHDYSCIGDAHWQKKADVERVGKTGKPGHEYGVEVPLAFRNGASGNKLRRLPKYHFQKDRQKRIFIAEQMRNHRWYQLEGALFTGYHTHIRAFGHKVSDKHHPPLLPKTKDLKVDTNKQRVPMVPYQLSPLQLAAKQDNLETARVLIHDFEYMVLDGEAVQVEASYRQLMFPDEPARKFEMVKKNPNKKAAPDGDTNTRDEHVKLPSGWDFPAPSNKAPREAMYNSPFVGDLIGNGTDGTDEINETHVPLYDPTDKKNAKFQKRLKHRLQKSWRILMQQEYHEMCMRNDTDKPFSKRDKKQYRRGIPWDAMYKVPEMHEQKTDYTEQWDRLGEFDFMHVFGASANHKARPKQKWRFMYKRLVGDTVRTQYFKKGHDAEPERRVRARTALDIAVYWGHFEMAKMLINAIVDLRQKGKLKSLSAKGYHHPEWDLLNVLQNAWEVNNLRRDYVGAKRKQKPRSWFKKKSDKSDEQEDEMSSARRQLDEYLRAAIDYPYLRPTLASRVLRFKTNQKSTMHKRHPLDTRDPFEKGRFAQVVARLLRPAKDFEAYKAQKWQDEDEDEDDV